jgi:uncharacterized membrane protein
MYFIIIKYGRENNIPHFIRFHTMHALLISILQIPIIYFHEELLNTIVLNSLLRKIIENLRITIILLDFSLVFYAMYTAAMGYSINIPIVTPACRKHIGKKPELV